MAWVLVFLGGLVSLGAVCLLFLDGKFDAKIQSWLNKLEKRIEANEEERANEDKRKHVSGSEGDKPSVGELST